MPNQLCGIRGCRHRQPMIITRPVVCHHHPSPYITFVETQNFASLREFPSVLLLSPPGTIYHICRDAMHRVSTGIRVRSVVITTHHHIPLKRTARYPHPIVEKLSHSAEIL